MNGGPSPLGQSVSCGLIIRCGSSGTERGPSTHRPDKWQRAVLCRIRWPRRPSRCRLLLHLYGEVHQVNHLPSVLNINKRIVKMFYGCSCWLPVQRCSGGRWWPAESFEKSLFGCRQSSTQTPLSLQQRWDTQRSRTSEKMQTGF